MIKQMTMFIKVAEMGSFTKAAEILNIPKAALSLGVNKLESHLGVRLLHRTTRHVQLTQDGAFFLKRCKALLSELEELETMFQKNKEQVKGTLRVDAPSRITRLILIQALPTFYAQYPKIKLELGSSDRILDLVQEGIDCVIRVGTPNDSSLIMKSFGTLDVINCAAPSYIKKYGTPNSLEDLSKHLLVRYNFNHSDSFGVFEYSDDQGKNHEIKMDFIISVNNVESYIASSIKGLGIIQVPSYDVQKELRNGSLVQVLPQYQASSMNISFLYPHKKHLSHRLKAFMEWAQESFEKYQLQK